MSNDNMDTEGEGNGWSYSDRREFLRKTAFSGLLGPIGKATASTDLTSRSQKNRNQPWAPDHHDHSGEQGSTAHLGVAAPVKSIQVNDLFSARQSTTIFVSELPPVTGSGTSEDPYISPSGTGGMREAFELLDALNGGVIYYPSGFYSDGTTSWEIDLANYDNLDNNWAIYGDGLESSRIRCGSDNGPGIRIHDSSGRAYFYIEIVGVRFEGQNDGFTFVWGSEDLGDAYNSCWTRFATGNSNPDGDGACQLNFVLNSYHYGVHNAAGGTAAELRRVQFSGIEGSFSSGGGPIEGGPESGEAIRIVEFSFANHFRYINVEATYDGIHIADSRAIYNVFQNAYFANIRGTAVVQAFKDEGRFGSDEQGTYFHNPFVAGAVGEIIDLKDGTLYVDGSTKRWPEYTVQRFQGQQFGGSFTDVEHLDLTPQGTPPAHETGRIALSNGEGWDPDTDGTAELVISTGEEWIEIQDLGTQF